MVYRIRLGTQAIETFKRIIQHIKYFPQNILMDWTVIIYEVWHDGAIYRKFTCTEIRADFAGCVVGMKHNCFKLLVCASLCANIFYGFLSD